MKPEQKFYEKIKRKFKKFSLIRLENNSLHGTPDLLVCNDSGHFFTIELKVCKGNKIRFSQHQISFHIKHPKYYTELRKRNKLDQAISPEAHDGERERAPGPGPKPQATSDTTASGLKLQATGSRLQAPSSDKKE